MLMTAAGTVPPARVLVIGAGVAGLQAIATARRLGAIVEAYDVRARGARAGEEPGRDHGRRRRGRERHGRGRLREERSAEGERAWPSGWRARVKAADAVITTALVPGQARAAPRSRPRPCAACARARWSWTSPPRRGGNCEGSRARQDGGARPRDARGRASTCPPSMAGDASRMYAKNVEEVVKHLTPKRRPRRAPPARP